mmetsp:Transcript_63369/g.160394  ORF Transcript_63369/g.160394 Transcript_63369/m.160394 type:complete len:221 (-) Transcript_63369:483-1145(-)
MRLTTSSFVASSTRPSWSVTTSKYAATCVTAVTISTSSSWVAGDTELVSMSFLPLTSSCLCAAIAVDSCNVVSEFKFSFATPVLVDATPQDCSAITSDNAAACAAWCDVSAIRDSASAQASGFPYTAAETKMQSIISDTTSCATELEYRRRIRVSSSSTSPTSNSRYSESADILLKTMFKGSAIKGSTACSTSAADVVCTAAAWLAARVRNKFCTTTCDA